MQTRQNPLPLLPILGGVATAGTLVWLGFEFYFMYRDEMRKNPGMRRNRSPSWRRTEAHLIRGLDRKFAPIVRPYAREMYEFGQTLGEMIKERDQKFQPDRLHKLYRSYHSGAGKNKTAAAFLRVQEPVEQAVLTHGVPILEAAEEKVAPLGDDALWTLNRVLHEALEAGVAASVGRDADVYADDRAWGRNWRKGPHYGERVPDRRSRAIERSQTPILRYADRVTRENPRGGSFSDQKRRGQQIAARRRASKGAGKTKGIGVAGVGKTMAGGGRRPFDPQAVAWAGIEMPQNDPDGRGFVMISADKGSARAIQNLLRRTDAPGYFIRRLTTKQWREYTEGMADAEARQLRKDGASWQIEEGMDKIEKAAAVGARREYAGRDLWVWRTGKFFDNVNDAFTGLAAWLTTLYKDEQSEAAFQALQLLKALPKALQDEAALKSDVERFQAMRKKVVAEGARLVYLMRYDPDLAAQEYLGGRQPTPRLAAEFMQLVYKQAGFGLRQQREIQKDILDRVTMLERETLRGDTVLKEERPVDVDEIRAEQTHEVADLAQSLPPILYAPAHPELGFGMKVGRHGKKKWIILFESGKRVAMTASAMKANLKPANLPLVEAQRVGLDLLFLLDRSAKSNPAGLVRGASVALRSVVRGAPKVVRAASRWLKTPAGRTFLSYVGVVAAEVAGEQLTRSGRLSARQVGLVQEAVYETTGVKPSGSVVRRAVARG